MGGRGGGVRGEGGGGYVWGCVVCACPTNKFHISVGDTLDSSTMWQQGKFGIPMAGFEQHGDSKGTLMTVTLR